MSPHEKEVADRVARNSANVELTAATDAFMKASFPAKYSYNFSWMGRPIIQYPQDIVAMQELIWICKPDLIIETGIAHGGSLIFSASMLELNEICGGPAGAKVVGVDIDIRAHNQTSIEAHPMFKRITLIEGSSIAMDVVDQVRFHAKGKRNILVCLDSSHTHEHVLAELVAYAPLTSIGNYCVVFDTMIDELPAEMFADRPWGPGDNPMTAVREFLASHTEFEADMARSDKLMISVAPSGFLKRLR